MLHQVPYYLFEDMELDVMAQVKDQFKEKYAKAVVEISDREIAWQENHESRSIINYDHTFELNLL